MYVKKMINFFSREVFTNQGAITEEDSEQIRIGIDAVKPNVFIEIGTGRGVSTSRIFSYLRENFPRCDFYTIEILKRYFRRISKKFRDFKTFHPLLGLSVQVEETMPPARDELRNYSGPSDVLRNIFNGELKNREVDIAFIDSRKGSSLAEFMILEKKLSKKGLIFCHDVNNNGKGVEVLEYLKAHTSRYDFQVIDTGPMGMIKVVSKPKFSGFC